jgi:hypothetical protein
MRKEVVIEVGNKIDVKMVFITVSNRGIKQNSCTQKDHLGPEFNNLRRMLAMNASKSLRRIGDRMPGRLLQQLARFLGHSSTS